MPSNQSATFRVQPLRRMDEAQQVLNKSALHRALLLSPLVKQKPTVRMEAGIWTQKPSEPSWLSDMQYINFTEAKVFELANIIEIDRNQEFSDLRFDVYKTVYQTYRAALRHCG
jgi:hypothetical protein